jgi:hypothetical protein
MRIKGGVFGNYYYAHISSLVDSVHSVIMKVEGSTREFFQLAVTHPVLATP